MTVVHLTYDFMEFDSRILKELKSISGLDSAEKLYLITALRDKKLPQITKLNNKTKILRLNNLSHLFNPGSVFQHISYLLWQFMAFFQVVLKKPQVVHCHNTETLLIGVTTKLILGSKLIYDAHELETERDEPSYILKFFYIIEKISLRFIDSIIVVNNSIRNKYIELYSIPKSQIHVIRNIPIYKQPKNSKYNLKKKYGIKKDGLLFGLIGMFGANRNIDLLLETFSKNTSHHIVFVGFGSMESKVISYSNRFSNIHFHPPVPMEDISSITSEFDVGFNISKATSKNVYLSLPNKIFEYLHGGTPIIVSDFPEMKNIVEEYQCGWIISPHEEQLGELLNQLNKIAVHKQEAKAISARKLFNWEMEEKILLNLYT